MVDAATELRARFAAINPLGCRPMRRTKLKLVSPPKPDDAQADRKRRLAANLNRILVDKGWRQSDLARLVFGMGKDAQGFNRPHGAAAISAYCAGRQMPERVRLERIAEVCGTTPDRLTGESDQPAGIRFTPTDGTKGRLTVDMECDQATFARIVALIAKQV